MAQPNKAEKGPRRNEEIRVPELRLIDDQGKMLGVISTREALNMARDKGLDLMEVDPGSNPPVAKILDYGKFKYELKKKQQEAKKKQVVIVIKEVQFRPKIEKHDFDFKIKHIERFLEEGNKAKICINFRGREMEHLDIANELVNRILDCTKEFAAIEQYPKLEGRKLQMILIPIKAAAAMGVSTSN